MAQDALDVKQLFQEVRLLTDLLSRPQERGWLSQPPPAPQPRRTVFYLGCNLLRTPHIAQTAIEVLRRLGEDFVAVGGPAFCCGLPYLSSGQGGAAWRLRGNSFNTLLRFSPQRVVVWCPSCLRFFREQRGDRESPELEHITTFLAARAGALPWEREVQERVALHYHMGDEACEEQAQAARALLQAIPGLKVVEVGSERLLGRNCSAQRRKEVGPSLWGMLVAPSLEQAMLQGATTLTTIYHSCQRLLCEYERPYPLKVENFITLVGQALGIEFEDRFKKYLMWQEESWILQDARPCLQASGTPEEQVRPLIVKNFVEGNVS